MGFISLSYIGGSCALLSYISMYLVLGIFNEHALHIIVVYRWVLSFAVIYKYQVLGIFRCQMLHITVVYWWVLCFAVIYKYQVLGIFKAIRFISLFHIGWSCLLLSYTSIRYFQMPFASYHCHLSVDGSCQLLSCTSIRYYVFSKAMCFISLLYIGGSYFCCHLQVLGIGYFKAMRFIIISLLYICGSCLVLLIYKYQVLSIFKAMCFISLLYISWSCLLLSYHIKYQVLGIFEWLVLHMVGLVFCSCVQV